MRNDSSLLPRNARVPTPSRKRPRGNWVYDNVLGGCYHVVAGTTEMYPFLQADIVEVLMLCHDVPIWLRGHTIYGLSVSDVAGLDSMGTTWLEKYRLYGSAVDNMLVTSDQGVLDPGVQLVGLTATIGASVKGHYLRGTVDSRGLYNLAGDLITCIQKMDMITRSGIVGDGPVLFSDSQLGTGVFPCILYEPHLTDDMVDAGWQYTEGGNTYIIVGLFNRRQPS